MGREVRRVPKNWKHPTGEHGQYIPLLDYGKPFSQVVNEWDEGEAKWKEGFKDDYHGGWERFDKSECMTFAEWYGERPKKEDYMPEFRQDKMTHYQMYETCSEGTPISPVMETPEDLAHWLADNNASAFGSSTATYQAWLCTIKAGFAPTFFICKNGELKSGVEACCKKGE